MAISNVYVDLIVWLLVHVIFRKLYVVDKFYILPEMSPWIINKYNAIKRSILYPRGQYISYILMYESHPLT